MMTSRAGIDAIKPHESEGGKPRLKAYLCPAGVWTIGFGHTKGVKKGDVCTAEQAEKYLAEDLEETEMYLNRVARINRWQLNQNQFDALVSLVFNIGSGNFDTSTVKRKLTESDYAAAAEAILLWNKGNKTVNGKVVMENNKPVKVVLPGLKKRREAERMLFLKADTTSSASSVK